MKGIESQFHGEMEIAGWIKKGIKQIPKLINKKSSYTGGNVLRFSTPKSHVFMDVIDLDMWVLGPSPKNSNSLCVWGSLPKGTSVMRIVRSINLSIDENGFHVTTVVQCSDGRAYKLEIDKSAHSIARRLDMLLHGAYTDIPLISVDVFLDVFHEHFEKEAKENVKKEIKDR